MQDRLKQLREILHKEGLDGLIISSRPNTYYFTGFTGTTSTGLVTVDKAYLIVDFRYTSQAKEQVFTGFEVIEHEKGAIDTLDELCTLHQVVSLGMEGGNVSYADYQTWQDKLKTVKTLKDIQDDMSRIRLIKDEGELILMKQAAEIADRAFSEVLPYLKPGIHEYEVAVELEYRMKKMGASGISFETIIASGPRSALPHGVAGIRKLQSGDAIVMDFGCIYKGYCSDMTRTVFLGNPPEQLKEIYQIVLRAQLEALDNATENMTGMQLDRVSREIIYAAGYEKCFGHGLGHGVGVEIHESPRVSPKGEDILKAGMVFTVEPGIYVENLGGVRIEDMVFLKGSTVDILSGSTKEMLIL